jgi:hypothetical protein
MRLFRRRICDICIALSHGPQQGFAISSIFMQGVRGMATTAIEAMGEAGADTGTLSKN